MSNRQIFYHRPGAGLGAIFLGPPVAVEDPPLYASDASVPPMATRPQKWTPHPLPVMVPGPDFGTDMGTPITGAPAPTTQPATPATKGGLFGSIPPLYLIGGAAAAYFLFFRKKR
jgi:hypothetical protein